MFPMKQHKWGRIVNATSILGLVGNAGKAAYVASKHAVVGHTKFVAQETAQMDITCNVVCSGFVNTPLLQKEIVKMAAEWYNGDVAKTTHQLMTEMQTSSQFISPTAVGRRWCFCAVQLRRRCAGHRCPSTAWVLRGLRVTEQRHKRK